MLNSIERLQKYLNGQALSENATTANNQTDSSMEIFQISFNQQISPLYSKNLEIYGHDVYAKIKHLINKGFSGIPGSIQSLIKTSDGESFFNISLIPVNRGHSVEIIECIVNKINDIEQLNPATNNTEQQNNDDAGSVENISLNIERNVKPILKKLSQDSTLSREGIAKVTMIDKLLNNINDTFFKKVKFLQANLTPTEIRICHFIKAGYALKEIADMLNISVNTTKVHAKHIRRKIGITNSRISLKKYFGSIQGQMY